MKKEDMHWLKEQIIEFMAVVDDCLHYTTYANDRTIYSSDLAMAARWLIRLYKNDPEINVCRDIVSPQTGKHFVDYWRQGSWGDNEIKALYTLQEQIRNRFNLKDTNY